MPADLHSPTLHTARRVRTPVPESVDVAIIGCGPGGLEAGALLARAGQKVACFDQHYVAGGCATMFERGRSDARWRFDVGLHYIGGILKHAKALAALTNPTTNSYRRLVPGYEAPVNLAYSSRNRSASIRIPVSGASANARRIEVRFPDSSCNPYLAFSARMMAGLDGVQNRIDPGDPLDKDIYSLSPEELRRVPSVPNSLDEALDSLEKDHEFLLKGDVFSRDLLETWLEYKRDNELDEVRSRPVPYEFYLYFDI